MTVESDRQVFLVDFGVDVTLGGVTTKALRDEALELMVEGTSVGDAVLGERDTLLIETGTLPAIAIDADITVDGEAMKVSSYGKMEDGKFTLVEVREA